jgi:hypothetical protein
MSERGEQSLELKARVTGTAKMQFVLTGFTHETGFRVFSFERMDANREWTKCTVRADLSLVRRYGIHIQELPLLCRSLLDRCEEDGAAHFLTFTEDEMRLWANDRTSAREAAAKKRKVTHRPAGENLGAAWRGQHS